MSSRSKLILPGGHSVKPQLVRNQQTGRVLPCCYGDCMRRGDNRFRIETPHSQPRWRDETTGKQEMTVYIFCGEPHRQMFAKGTPYERFL